MRTLCPNIDKENGLETVLEVPIPEEMFTRMGSSVPLRWQNMRNKMRAQRSGDKTQSSTSSNDQFMLLLKIIGSPLIPYHLHLNHSLSLSIRDGSFEASTAKYIVQQYIAATGGLAVLNTIDSMYAVGQVNMVSSPIQLGDIVNSKRSCDSGGFVVWQKDPDLWYLELVVSSCKVSAGSDGKVGWSQSSNSSNVTRGPPRPLRRFFQGLDPRSTVDLFLHAVCIGEKTINGEDCFILKLETSTDTLKAQCTANTEAVHHTIWGYFSQRTGLLIQFEDTKLVRMKAARKDDNVYWETSMVSVLDDYRYVDGINIAHGGKTTGTLYRYGQAHNHRGKIEETWKIEDIDFNICGLSRDSFLPPAEVRKAQAEEL